ncbi:hypothetical protein EYB26_004450 [Talaromyces marneffei]|uniref:uncharacterized protein n=1 Tax=Talaromyces marneffei TaxID=37727 RepID=UPI0012AA9E69|nr:uncharacterized protein EYB26_004450 [Talaromyces marneffei]QGA16780.1 hypothetical protein EYB26_004450 [Talaromyces marneffei]
MAILDCVGHLYRWNPLTKQPTDPRSISAFEVLIVGRNRKTCQYVFDDACVSNQHVQIYTVIYDLEHPLDIPPLVYAQDVSTNGTFWNGQRIDRRNGGAVLLSDGDILRLSSNSFLEFRAEYQFCRPLNQNQQKEIKEFANEYLITDRLLGEGGFGHVRMAVNLKATSQVACKIVNLRAVKETVMRKKGDRSTDMLELQKREVAILQKLCHPNIIGVEKFFTMENSLYIFEDLITAGDLFTFIESKGGRITDFEAASVTRQILIAVDYLHDNNIVHRDLKPENILMTSHGVQRRVVLADFGCARIVSPGIKRMSTVVGTWDYTAPEVYKELKAGYTKSVDLWSVGCVTVVLLIGTPPFPFSVSGDVGYIEPGDLNEMFMSTKSTEASTMARNFVLSLLVLDERKRLNSKQALQHSWFSNEQYQSKLQQLYEEAIQDWHPRYAIAPSGSENCLQSGYNCSNKALRTAVSSTFQVSKSQAATFVSERRDVIEKNRRVGSDKASPSSRGQNMYDRTICDKIRVSQSSPTSQNFRRSFSPQAWNTKSVASRFASSSSKSNVNRNNIDVSTLKEPKSNLTEEHESWTYISTKLNEGICASTDKSIATSKGITRAKRGFDELSQSPEIGEVYEEIENKITGKVQRVLYKEK